MVPELVYKSRMCTGMVPELVYKNRMCTGMVPELVYKKRMCTGMVPELVYKSRMCTGMVEHDYCPMFNVVEPSLGRNKLKHKKEHCKCIYSTHNS